MYLVYITWTVNGVWCEWDHFHYFVPLWVPDNMIIFFLFICRFILTSVVQEKQQLFFDVPCSKKEKLGHFECPKNTRAMRVQEERQDSCNQTVFTAFLPWFRIPVFLQHFSSATRKQYHFKHTNANIEEIIYQWKSNKNLFVCSILLNIFVSFPMQ